MRFGRRCRLRRAADFKKVRRSGRRIDYGPFILERLPSQLRSRDCLSRIGIIASRRVGKAVVRNRGKRLFREIFRQASVPQSDMVVVVRPSFIHYSFEELRRRFLKALSQKALGPKVKRLSNESSYNP